MTGQLPQQAIDDINRRIQSAIGIIDKACTDYPMISVGEVTQTVTVSVYNLSVQRAQKARLASIPTEDLTAQSDAMVKELESRSVPVETTGPGVIEPKVKSDE